MDARVFRPPCMSPSFSLNLVCLKLSVRGVITVIQAGNIRRSVVWFYSQLRSTLLGCDLEGFQPHLRVCGCSVGDVSTQGGGLAVDITHLGPLLTPLTVLGLMAPQWTVLTFNTGDREMSPEPTFFTGMAPRGAVGFSRLQSVRSV